MRRSLIFICIICLLILPLSGCNGEDPNADAAEPAEAQEEGGEETKSGDPYDDYIRNALENVNNDKAPEDNTAEAVPSPPAVVTPYPIVTPEAPTPAPFAGTPDDTFYSSDDYTDTRDASPNDSSSTDTASSTGSDSTTSTDASETPTPTPYITPDEFTVGKCCIYINGESDSAFGSEVVTAINKTRKDLGYDELIKNKGLATCADRRTREVAALRSHLRPNGQMYYTLAPEHFKAEMIIVGTQKAAAAVDALIKTDPASRYLVFSEKYKSVGASSFKCNGLQYTVVAFGL
ncbi:MAG: hypothetical protein K6E49_10745 [Lachnospiraceae bacterium]|nr:hypothetical protein [Lachnospiraceae bacterium]